MPLGARKDDIGGGEVTRHPVLAAVRIPLAAENELSVTTAFFRTATTVPSRTYLSSFLDVDLGQS